MNIVGLKPEYIFDHFIAIHPEIPNVLHDVDYLWHRKAVLRYQAAALYGLTKFYARRNILEIGTATGYTAAIMAKACPDVTVTTINPNRKEFQASSKHLTAFSNVKSICEASIDFWLRGHAEIYDFIFVDGDHRNVANDFIFWENLTPGGVIIFHDYSPRNAAHPVPVVWHQLNFFKRLLNKTEFDILITDVHKTGIAGFIKEASGEK
jgi:predicted O-methyltransferase YrrM